ncbi:uncharacterized protein [Miscanthus floridulus]|uniref:uncharacterized protein n=1 Tax=Miscanthus floridulus TaxID=154761 RepID=UPI0034592127
MSQETARAGALAPRLHLGRRSPLPASTTRLRIPGLRQALLRQEHPDRDLYSLTMAGFRSLAPKTRNLVVAGGLSAFVLGVYYYTMRAVGGTDELQVAIDKFEDMKKKDAARNSKNAGGS